MSNGARTLDFELRGGRAAPAEARQALGHLERELGPPAMEVLRLLVTELVTNAVRHARVEQVGVKVAVGKEALLVEVSDTGPGFRPEEHDAYAADDSGWGLYLVGRLADAWGVKQERNGTRVWFRLRRD